MARQIGVPSQYSDVMRIEGAEGFESNEREYFEAMQRTVNAGTWGLQGSFGRTMMQAIENGDVLLGKVRARDYYGNVIPSRDDVEAGTKGSYDYVANARDAEWADKMAAL